MLLKQHIIILLIILTTGCAKEYDGRLRGKWKLIAQETDGISRARDSIYYNFDNHVFCLQRLYNEGYGADAIYGEFTQHNDTVVIEIKDEQFLDPYVFSLTEWKTPIRRFTLKNLSSNNLTLADNDERYLFIRF